MRRTALKKQQAEKIFSPPFSYPPRKPALQWFNITREPFLKGFITVSIPYFLHHLFIFRISFQEWFQQVALHTNYGTQKLWQTEEAIPCFPYVPALRPVILFYSAVTYFMLIQTLPKRKRWPALGFPHRGNAGNRLFFIFVIMPTFGKMDPHVRSNDHLFSVNPPLEFG